MKIVIDIPEEDYKSITKQIADGITNPLKICIVNGKPLPEGYGRLIDADALFEEYEKTGWFYNSDRDKVAEKILLDAPNHH